MKQRLTFIILLFLLAASLNIHAQELLVSNVGGTVKVRNGEGKYTRVCTFSKLKMTDMIKVESGGRLDICDEKSKKRYNILQQGTMRLSEHIKVKGNTIVELADNYVKYITRQYESNSNNGKILHKQVYTDYATVTRELLEWEEKEEEYELDSLLETLPIRERHARFRSEIRKRHNEFRASVMQRHLEFVREVWTKHNLHTAIERPTNEDIGPRVAPYGDVSADRMKAADWFKGVISSAKDFGRIIKSSAISIVTPPHPHLDVEEFKPIGKEEVSYFPFEYFGTMMSVRLDESLRVNIGKISPRRVANVLERFGGWRYENLIFDCLQLRDTHHLGDWAYFEMIQKLCEEFCGSGTNEAVLLEGYLAYRSGYSVRFATNEAEERLYLLMQSQHIIYGHAYFPGKTEGERFYMFGDDVPDKILMCEAEFPGEQGLSFYIDTPMLLTNGTTAEREIRGYRFRDNVVSIATNGNLINFYNTYPASEVAPNPCTRWAMYARTPLDPAVTDRLYPQLRRLMEGKDIVEQVNILLDLIHGLPYAYDNEVWGHDRAFFAEETLHYEGCDCEDRAILFTRLVRDLLQLPCALIYYPGHLATAIHFDDEVQGDQFIIDGENYIVCDPTYLGSNVGIQMPDMDIDNVQIIMLGDK